MIETLEPYKPSKNNPENEVARGISHTLSKVRQNEKVKYLQELRDDFPNMYGKKGDYPNLINKLLAEIPEATSLLGTDKPLNETLRTYDLFESARRSEWNNNGESVRPNNTFGKPTPKQNERSVDLVLTRVI